LKTKQTRSGSAGSESRTGTTSPPGSDWADESHQPDDGKSVPGTDQGHSFRWLSLDDLGTNQGRRTRRYETAGS